MERRSNSHTFAAGVGLQLTVDKDLIIDATSLPAGITVSGADFGRAFNVNGAGLQVAIHGVSVKDGNSTSTGGGIRVGECRFTLTHSAIYNNQCTTDGGAFLLKNARVLLENVTISGNYAGDQGGGIFAWDGSLAVIRHSTIAENESVGTAVGLQFSASDLGMYSSVVAENRRSNGNLSNASFPSGGSFTSLGRNITDGTFLTDSTDSNSVDALLAPLANAGGLAMCHPPLTGSPIVDGSVILAGPPTTDGRAYARVFGPAPDVGAFELGPMGADKDADGMDDFWETYYGLDPSDPADASGNTDSDGDTNLTEYQNQTDPGTVSPLVRPLRIRTFEWTQSDTGFQPVHQMLDLHGLEARVTLPSISKKLLEQNASSAPKPAFSRVV